MASPNEITVSQLSRLIGTPDAPVLIDVRVDEDWQADQRLVPGSRRFAHDTVAEWGHRYHGRRTVIICTHGKKLSQGVAALLRCAGIAAESLEGGFEVWRETGQPLVGSEKIPPRNAAGKTLWVTRERPKIDRIACPWLIRRFVDPEADFLFVKPSDATAVADRFSATPFDIDDVFWSHRGENCTFDTMIEEFGIASEPLNRLASIVRGADTARFELADQCAGLAAVSLGLSRMYKDDLRQLDAGLGIYDAFYRWCRDATGETHNWHTASNTAR